MTYNKALADFNRRRQQSQRSIEIGEKLVKWTSYSGMFNLVSKLFAPPVIALLGTLLLSQITNGSFDPMDDNRPTAGSVAFKVMTPHIGQYGHKSYTTLYDLLIVMDMKNNSFNIYEPTLFDNYELIRNRTLAQTKLMNALAALSSEDENILLKLYLTLSQPLQSSFLSDTTVKRKTGSIHSSSFSMNGDYAKNLKVIIQDFLDIVSSRGYIPSDASTQNWSWGKKWMASTLGLELALIFAAVCSRLSLGHAKRKLEELESKPPAIGPAGLRFSGSTIRACDDSRGPKEP